jgi:hypothetical protein
MGWRKGEKTMLKAVKKAKLGDKRRNERLGHLVEALSANPGATIPEACGSARESKSAYRFLG